MKVVKQIGCNAVSAEQSVKNNLNSFQVPLKDHPTEKSIMGQSNQRHHPPSVLTFPSVHFISFEMFQWDGKRTSRKLRSRRILCGQPFDGHHILHSRREVATSLSYAFLYRNQTTWFCDNLLQACVDVGSELPSIERTRSEKLEDCLTNYSRLNVNKPLSHSCCLKRFQLATWCNQPDDCPAFLKLGVDPSAVNEYGKLHCFF